MRTRSKTFAIQGDVQHYQLDAKRKPKAVGAQAKHSEFPELSKVRQILQLNYTLSSGREFSDITLTFSHGKILPPSYSKKSFSMLCNLL